MRAERIESSLQSRFWTFNRGPDAGHRQIVYLSDGSGEAEVDGFRHAISAPAVLWLGDGKQGRLRTAAGATGFRGWIRDGMVVAAIGDQEDSAGLAQLVDRSFVLSLSGQEDKASVLERCFAGVLSELRQPQTGTTLTLSALLRIMLVAMFRASGADDVVLPGTGEKTSLLQRFRQLVEMNFRSHWTVSRYADALGISADRLHAICSTSLGKSPKALISERLAREAATRLERSSLTIEQLGHALGFNDPAHFSSFFRKMTGLPPGRYRKAAVSSRLEGRNAPTPSFADWP